MAYLFDADTETFFPLAPHHTFGRLADSVDTPLNKPYISKLHTAIDWSGEHWRIKNLGRNGTLVNGALLQEGEQRSLQLQDVIHLADPQDKGFKVIDLAPPCDMLWPLTNQHSLAQPPQPIPLEHYHLLPNEQLPELALFCQQQQWYLEPLDQQGEDLPSPLSAGDLVQFNNSHWQLIRATIYGPTEARPLPPEALSTLEFVFELSLDEEDTQLSLKQPQCTIDLGVRSHHYLLLQLARHRAQDIALGLAPCSQGWIYAEQLAAELGMDNTHVNIHIFRARKQITDALPHALGHSKLLERRGGKLRFGCDNFKIYKGANLVTQSQSAPHSQPLT
jgi:hypothetical protein